MRASIIVATRNRRPQLEHGLASIQRQKYRDVETIIVDDESTDGTSELLVQAEKWARVEWLRRSDGTVGFRWNPADVLNRGHALATAPVHIEQGGEVCHMNDCVSPLVDACEPGVLALATVFNGDVADMQHVAKAIQDHTFTWGTDVETRTPEPSGDVLSPVPRVPVCDGLTERQIELYVGMERQAPFQFLGAIHRDTWAELKGYQNGRGMRNDEDLARRMIAMGCRFRFVAGAVAFHLRHGKT